MSELAVVIPSRNEIFLRRTIEDLLANMRGDTRIIAVLDGQWADPPVDQHPKVTLIYHPESVGQRAACNEAAKIAFDSKYIMKCDAHCAFDEGFDVKLMADMQDDWTVVPIMRNLHTFDWVCKNGHRRYQSPSGPCKECGEPTEMEVVWIPKRSPQSLSYCFDAEPHFQYFGEYLKREGVSGDFNETMSLQGSCFMMTRDKWFELDVCDESFGSWGSQGIEVAVKTWLSGGRVICNHKTWYAHQFRTQGGDFGFPYELSGRQVEHAKKTARGLFFTNSWPKQVRPLSWLVEKFWPVKGWTDEDLERIREFDHVIGNTKVTPVEEPDRLELCSDDTAVVVDDGHGTGTDDVRNPVGIVSNSDKDVRRGVLYYTDNRITPLIQLACQRQIAECADIWGMPIVSVSLLPMDFGTNISIPLERGYLTMFKQILMGLIMLEVDVVYFCEHDVLYSPSHFEFIPLNDDTYYYNQNCWKVDYNTGHSLYYDCKQTSQLCAKRELLITHYTKRVLRVEKEGFSRKMGFEPGSHGRSERVDDYGSDIWRSETPNIDIRHDANLTSSRWKQEEFRDKRNCRNWQDADEVPGWGYVGKTFQTLLGHISRTHS